MRAGDVLAISATTLLGGVTWWLLGGMIGAVVGGIGSGILAFAGARANIRPAIVSTVLVGTMAGALIGSSIVQAICLPSVCRPLEVTGGIVAAAFSFVGVGLVAALVARSFDEHNERTVQGLAETDVGCEAGEETVHREP